ncbi:hypothetical protein PAPHI01_0606 [Pancytospora philotis]|nr:hypothetical protein PAPHI01_0606 [Pancytospora philotis]
MRDFLKRAEEISSKIRRLEEYADEIHIYIAQKQNSVLNENEEDAIDTKIDAATDLFTALSVKVKMSIKKDQDETLDMKQKGGKKGIIETRELYNFRHSRDLANVTRKYQSIQCEYKEKENAKLRDTFLIANPDATEEDLQLLTDGMHGEAQLASAFALGSRSTQAVLLQAKNRNKKIGKIAEKVEVLVQLLKDIDRLVKNTRPSIDNIALNMESAEAHTTKAVGQLTAAAAYQRRAMFIKRIIFAVVIVCIILLGLYFFSVFYRRPSKKLVGARL